MWTQGGVWGGRAGVTVEGEAWAEGTGVFGGRFHILTVDVPGNSIPGNLPDHHSWENWKETEGHRKL